MAGYSATPLARKLSLKDGLRTWWQDMPGPVREEIETAGLALVHLSAPEAPIDAAHVFLSRNDALRAAIAELRPLLSPSGFLWISWPKKSSGLASEVTELADELEAVLAAGADGLPAIVAALNARGGTWTESTLRQRLAELGAQPSPGSPAAFGAFIAEFTERWGKVIRTAGIKGE